MSADLPWTLRIFRLAIAVAIAFLLLSIAFVPRFPSDESSNSTTGRNAAIENLRLTTSDRAIAHLSTLRAGERALRALQAANRSSARLAEQTLNRSAAELESTRAARSATLPNVVPPPGARFLAPIEQLTAQAQRRGNVFDIELNWAHADKQPDLRFEIWRWTATAEPRLIVGDCAACAFVDRGLPPGPIQLGYAVFAVSSDGTGSRSESRVAQVELGALHRLRLVETPLAERHTPPEPIRSAAPLPSVAPQSVRIEITRIEDEKAEIVEVRPGDTIGIVCATGHELVSLHWTEQSRPVRYREPMFHSDGTLVPGENGAATKSFVLEEPVWLPAAEVRDGWGRSLQLLPPIESPHPR